MVKNDLLDHLRHPRNVGVIEDADGVGKVKNPLCGDVLNLHLEVRDGRITDARFQSFGCGPAAATASMVTELIRGKTVEEVPELVRREMAPVFQGLPMKDKHCSRLAEEALAKAIEDYRSRNP